MAFNFFNKKPKLDPAVASRIPPGQYLTEKWPVLHAGDVAHVDVATWQIRLFGEVEEEVTLDYEQLRALPATEITTVTRLTTVASAIER